MGFWGTRAGIPLPACGVYVEIQLKAMQYLTLMRNLKKTRVCLLIYFDKLQHEQFCNCKVLQKIMWYFFQKHLYSFGDQQLTETID